MLVVEKGYLNPNLTRDSLVSALGTNKAYFIHIFKETYHTVYRDYLTRLRIGEALVLLEDSRLTIEDVALLSGFGTSRTLYRNFTRQMGATPSEYRKRNKSANM